MNNCQVKVRQCRTPVPTVWQFCWLMGIAWIGVFLIGCSNPALDSRSRERAKEQPARGTEEDLEVLQRGAPLADVKAKLKLTVDLDYIMAFSTAIQEYAKHYRTSMFPDWTSSSPNLRTKTRSFSTGRLLMARALSCVLIRREKQLPYLSDALAAYQVVRKLN
jgi:hypothetical protein